MAQKATQKDEMYTRRFFNKALVLFRKLLEREE